MFGWLILGLGVWAIASASKPTQRAGGQAPSPSPSPPVPAPVSGGGMALGETSSSGTGGKGVHVLTAVDVAMPPPSLATALGFDTIDDLVDRNPQFELIDGSVEGWPPVVTPFYYAIAGGTEAPLLYTPTRTVSRAYDLPVYARVRDGGIETVVFPTWAQASWNGVGYAGHAPVVVEDGDGVVFQESRPGALFTRAIHPWAAGLSVHLPGTA